MPTSLSKSSSDKKGHMCPPSDAAHPSDRWESLFVYGFICKFTQLRTKVEGFHSPMDFEDALLSPEPNLIMTQILSRFVLNLRPGTRNLSSDIISSTVAGVVQEYLKTSERTVFWDDASRQNSDPFQDMPNGFFAAEWDLKLKVLRQLVELQLCHSHEIKAVIDRAWDRSPPVPPPPGDPHSQVRLQLVPLGQDRERKRYWVVDDSPRVYLSTNPWKISATFQTVSSSRDEFMAFLETVKETASSEPKFGERRSKLEIAHSALLKALQERIEVIDSELMRIQRAQKKIQQRNLLIASAELRETRTRRRTTRPNYVYMNNPESDLEADEYTCQQPDDEDEEYEDTAGFDDEVGKAASSRGADTRRSTRTNGNRVKEEWSDWRGERRSTRLGAPSDTALDEPPPKRARTDESAASGDLDNIAPSNGKSGSGLKIKINGAAAVKTTETAVEAIAGKKKSKFWYYAVEPIPGAKAPVVPAPSTNARQSGGDAVDASSEGHNGHGARYPSTTPSAAGSNAEEPYEKSIGVSLSPASESMES
ncbi:uncharacterized protein BXZ73DRAFT_87172 [Epithele typhae]|uniref:uncharacterized protein n=1 Tax=Epithele typhae TaxID=378194 RepID=UPI002007840A|nr:uncharacterized protein BXZ73DRAFT_87172 [Epithele typhae]KAH9944232.1 hypothetical protein BXZ73DRAFT_87172 [Epithele typhae]